MIEQMAEALTTAGLEFERVEQGGGTVLVLGRDPNDPTACYVAVAAGGRSVSVGIIMPFKTISSSWTFCPSIDYAVRQVNRDLALKDELNLTRPKPRDKP